MLQWERSVAYHRVVRFSINLNSAALVSQMPGAKSTEYRIAQLDGWRGISILLVLVGHLFSWRYGAHPGEDFHTISDTMSDWGVYIFFVISGFIITKLALQERANSGRYSVRNFYTRRFFRIVPPFFLYLGFVVLADAVSLISQRNSETIVAAAFVCNIPAVPCGPFVAHSWTLATEEQFYLMFPLFFAMAVQYIRKYIGVLFFILAIVPSLIFLLNSGYSSPMVARSSFAFSYIFAGAVTAISEKKLQNLVESGRDIYVSCGVALATLGVVLLNTTITFPRTSALANLQISLQGVIIPIFIAWIVGTSMYQTNILTRILTWQPLLYIGMISYSLYLWQELFLAPRHLYISNSLLLYPPLVFVVGSLSYYFVERPCVRFGKHLIGGAVGRETRATLGKEIRERVV